MTIRLPEGMREELNRIADRNGRSANAEIVHRLQQSLSPMDNPDVVAMRECFRAELAKTAEQIISELKD